MSANIVAPLHARRFLRHREAGQKRVRRMADANAMLSARLRSSPKMKRGRQASHSQGPRVNVEGLARDLSLSTPRRLSRARSSGDAVIAQRQRKAVLTRSPKLGTPRANPMSRSLINKRTGLRAWCSSDITNLHPRSPDPSRKSCARSTNVMSDSGRSSDSLDDAVRKLLCPITPTSSSLSKRRCRQRSGRGVDRRARTSSSSSRPGAR